MCIIVNFAAQESKKLLIKEAVMNLILVEMGCLSNIKHN